MNHNCDMTYVSLGSGGKPKKGGKGKGNFIKAKYKVVKQYYLNNTPFVSFPQLEELISPQCRTKPRINEEKQKWK